MRSDTRIKLASSLIVQFLTYTLVDSAHIASPITEAICIRDPLERNSSQFGGRNMIATRTIRDPDLIEEDEESRYLKMVAQGTVFVDKSLLIEKIMKMNEKVIVINAPRRSGKTVNLNMLKDFFEIRVRNEFSKQTLNHELSIVSSSQTSTYRFFTEGKLDTSSDRPLVPLCYRRPPDHHLCIDPNQCRTLLNEGETVRATYVNAPMISERAKDIVEKHLGQYSVIYLDFKIEKSNWGWSEETVSDALKTRICNVFTKSVVIRAYMRQHKDDGRMTNEGAFEYYLHQCTSAGGKLTANDLEDSMISFSRLLNCWTDKPVIILLDNYDMFFENILFGMNYYNNENAEACRLQIQNDIQLLKNFLRKTFGQNPFLAKAVVTGTLSVSKKNIFAGIPRLVYYNVIDNHLEEFYGFTSGEVRLLFDHFEIPADRAERALQHYKGYTSKRGGNFLLYNMESIEKFLNYKVIKNWWIQKVKGLRLDGKSWKRYRRGVNYWLNFGKLEIVLQPLIAGNDVGISFKEPDFDKEDMISLIQPPKNANATGKVTKKGVDVAFSMLLEMGFLTLANRHGNIRVRVPNPEIRQGLQEFVNKSSMVFRVK